MRKRERLYIKKPIRGIFTVGKTDEKNKIALSRGNTSIGYFVPFKKNSDELAWSKAVQMSSRKYASTYEECVQLYNKLILNKVEWHQQEIEDLKKELIQLR